MITKKTTFSSKLIFIKTNLIKILSEKDFIEKKYFLVYKL